MVDFAALTAKLREKKAAQSLVSTPVPEVYTENVNLANKISDSGLVELEKKIPSRLGFELQEKVLALEKALLERHPRMPVLLREIHTVLRAQPENVTLFSEEEIAILVDGLKVQTSVEFASSITKGSGAKSATAKIKALGIGAF